MSACCVPKKQKSTYDIGPVAKIWDGSRSTVKLLTKAQRQGKKRLVKKYHAKIKARRQDFSHKASERLARSYQRIYFGDGDSRQIAQTMMSQGVLDAGWYQVYSLPQYKTMRRGGILLKGGEKFSTVTCSVCPTRCGPRGLSGLSLREWTCQSCGAAHDRDINSAVNILRSGRGTLRGECHGMTLKGRANYNTLSN